jgi:hypothetical protein
LKSEFELVDNGIRPAVEILNRHGFKTFESCEGGNDHAFADAVVRFEGNEFDLLRAYEICECYRLCVNECKRVYRKIDVYKKDNISDEISIGKSWDKPFNEIIFLKHSETGTIFLPH